MGAISLYRPRSGGGFEDLSAIYIIYILLFGAIAP